MKNLFITSISSELKPGEKSLFNYKLFYEEYIDSLRNLGKYNNDILVLNYGVDLPKINDSRLFIENKKLFTWHNNQRYLDIHNLNINHDIIYITDIDIWFQDSVETLFKIAQYTEGYVYTPDTNKSFNGNKVPWDSVFIRKEDEQNFFCRVKEIKKNFSYAPNMGISGGKIQYVNNKMKNYANKFSQVRDNYGADALIMIYNFNKGDIVLPPRFNWLTKRGMKKENGFWVDESHSKIIAIHLASSVRKNETEYFYRSR